MKKKLSIKTVGAILFLALGISCAEKKENKGENTSLSSPLEATNETPKKPLSEDFKQYWYAGDAEITSYRLKQARYGELWDGNAVLIYVTEPFLPENKSKPTRISPKTYLY